MINNTNTNRRRLLYALLFISLILMSCNDSSPKEIIQKDNHWVFLDTNDALQSEGGLSWDFQLLKKGSYDIQIVCDGEINTPFPKVAVVSAGKVLEETPQQIFVLDNEGKKQSIFQFKGGMTYKETGVHTLKINLDTLVAQVRIIPSYKKRLGFGSGKYYDEWLMMHKSPEKQAGLKWLNDAKYGMFIHWGLYSEAAGSWKGTRIEDSPYPGPRVAEWLMFTFKIPRAEYRELAKRFNPDKSFAQNIAKLAKEGGMKYVVITSKHHDGFALFDSECSDFDITDASPYEGDAVKELYDACLAEGIKFGVYYSHGNDWADGADGNYANVKAHNDSLGILSHPNGKNLWDPSPNTHAEYIENKAYPQVKELLHLLPELALIWFDGDGYVTEEQSYNFYKMIYDINPKVIVNRRIGYDFGDYLDAGDNVIPSASDKLSKQWETCGTTNNSWGYKAYDQDWKSDRELLYYLIDIASKGGNYLLNIGPDGQGHVPESSAEGLRAVGQWLAINGEAIYGTTRWNTVHEGQDETLLKGTGHRAEAGFVRKFSTKDFWFTTKGDKVFAISLVPAASTVEIHSLKSSAGKISKVSLLGNDKVLEWRQTEKALEIDMNGIPTGENGYALAIEIKE